VGVNLETIIHSDSKKVVIGNNQPFVIIGERINPTGRKILAAEMEAGDFHRVQKDALAQAQAGAHVIDVNAGIPLADEAAILAEAIIVVQDAVDVPISIDSSIVDALKSGLKVCKGKPLVNSVTGEEERLSSVLPLVADHGAAVIGITNDERGISPDPQVRFDIARRIIERAESYGIPRNDILIDLLTMPIGAVPDAVVVFMDVLRRLKNELGVNTVCGVSNISFGMPDRISLNTSFLSMAIGAGLTSAILNPLNDSIVTSILACDVLMDRDEFAMNWINARAASNP